MKSTSKIKAGHESVSDGKRSPVALVDGLAAVIALSIPATTQASSLRIEADQDVELRVVNLDWSLEGPFARRSVELILRNPHARALEATLHLPLAADERLQAYALDVDGRMRDAVPVERVQARAVFEETVRRQLDPALAQKGAGNAYRIRVFPVPARSERRVRFDVASLADRAACGWQHRLEMPLSAGQSVKTTVNASNRPVQAAVQPALNWQQRAGQFHASWELKGQTRAQVVCLPAPTGDAAFSIRLDDGMQMDWLEVPVNRESRKVPQALPTRLEIVWDASYSMAARDRSADLRLLQALLEGRRSQLVLTVLREAAERQAWSINSAGDLKRFIDHLHALPADGATRLAGWQQAADTEACFIFSDLVPTLPQGLLKAPHRPVHVITQGLSNPALARWLTRSGGQVLDLTAITPEEALHRLSHAPAAQAVPGPQASGWSLGSDGAGTGPLRACHISAEAAHVAALPVRYASRDKAPEIRRHKARSDQTSPQAVFWCATWWAESLEHQPELNRTQLAMIGQRFGVPNSETSLLVLESDDDYVRHGVLPPLADQALRDRVVQQRALAEQHRAEVRAQHQLDLERGWKARTEWWQTSFPKDPLPRLPVVKSAGQAVREGGPPPPPPPPPQPAPTAESADSAQPSVEMRLQAVPVNAPYAEVLRIAPSAAHLYPRYLDLRRQYGRSPAFHFDVAQRFFELGDTKLGWRVLSNAIELLPRDHANLRLVAYRLLDAGLRQEAELLLRQIAHLAPDEPQSFRDLALALPPKERCQEALDLLAHVVDTPWHTRFTEVGLIALAEYNDLRTRCSASRQHAWPQAMKQALPVGLRVVLRWDLNDTDLDLHVTDPNGEIAYFAHRRTYQGGSLSRDFTGGYGPEEFILRDPKPGEYKVSVNYYGSRLARLTRGVVLNLSLQTGFGTPQMQQQTVSMRLLEQSGHVLVGGFTVRQDGQLVVQEVAP